MTRQEEIEFLFVDYIPNELEEGILYIAAEFGAVVHLCFDGCGERVSTPLHPGQWTLTFDGTTVSLSPSVGNWGLPCRSHYIIRRNRVVWAADWSTEAVVRSAASDRQAVDRPAIPRATNRRSLIQILKLVFSGRGSR
ncbi:hypothetical protein QF046_001683 [Microbacterium sp. W4I4]|uniref:DUF6527 family protein n=1 Tax=Microbacterium sp. W4I4 TaxID=3042295 RepID=UPI002784A948|nr:DUF6527 family protein [Microbacterium sp. W4I4]MDQ0614042.1 hypothetical protein [Microbacterium sp. W4I4]